MTSDPSALAAVQQELMVVRAQLAERAGTGVQRGTTQNSAMVGRIVGAAVLGGLAGLLLLLAVIARATGDLGIGLVFLAPGLALAAGTAVLVRSAAPYGAAPYGAGSLPAPPDRQPSAYAQIMHARFPAGRSPERALRELPPDAPVWKLSLHRTLGWGTAGPLVLLLVLVIIPVAVAATG